MTDVEQGKPYWLRDKHQTPAAGDESKPLLQRQNSRTQHPCFKRQLTHFAVPDSHSHENLNGILPSNTKADFIKKVYTVLALELLLTAAIVMAFMYHVPLRDATISWVKAHNIMYLVLMIVSMIASLFSLMVFKNRYPSNIWLCMLFVLVMSVVIGVPCATYAAAGKGAAVGQALAITSALFLGLSAYCHWSGQDFSFMGGFLFCALSGNILLGFVAMMTGMSALMFVYHCFGILIFCGFILYDTSQIIIKYGCDDWLIGSIDLYLDFINLFLHVLDLLT